LPPGYADTHLVGGVLSSSAARESLSQQRLRLLGRNAEDDGQLARADAMPIHEHLCFARGILHQAPDGPALFHHPNACLNSRQPQRIGVWLAHIASPRSVPQTQVIRPARQLTAGCQRYTPGA
jgi:hypothetical protein